MKNLIQFVTLGLLSYLSTPSTPAFAQSIDRPTNIPQTPPNITLPIHRASGNCPTTIDLWTDFRYYEGGGENTVILDTTAIAGPAKFMDSQDRVVIYGAPLQPRYVSCVGWVISEDEPQYNIWLQFGSAYFRFDLDTVPGRFESAITYQNIVAGRPFLRWAIVD